jgi:hypothetical protein
VDIATPRAERKTPRRMQADCLATTAGRDPGGQSAPPLHITALFGLLCLICSIAMTGTQYRSEPFWSHLLYFEGDICRYGRIR